MSAEHTSFTALVSVFASCNSFVAVQPLCVQNLRRRGGARAVIPSPHDDPATSCSAPDHAAFPSQHGPVAVGAQASRVAVAAVQTTSDWDRVDSQLVAAVQSGELLRNRSNYFWSSHETSLKTFAVTLSFSTRLVMPVALRNLCQCHVWSMPII